MKQKTQQGLKVKMLAQVVPTFSLWALVETEKTELTNDSSFLPKPDKSGQTEPQSMRCLRKL